MPDKKQPKIGKKTDRSRYLESLPKKDRYDYLIKEADDMCTLWTKRKTDLQQKKPKR